LGARLLCLLCTCTCLPTERVDVTGAIKAALAGPLKGRREPTPQIAEKTMRTRK
jgi:hypothetical protein